MKRRWRRRVRLEGSENSCEGPDRACGGRKQPKKAPRAPGLSRVRARSRYIERFQCTTAQANPAYALTFKGTLFIHGRAGAAVLPPDFPAATVAPLSLRMFIVPNCSRDEGFAEPGAHPLSIRLA
jgi:hypothetical protein